MGPGGHISGGGKAYGIVDTSEYRAMNPNGTIPTMDDDGYIIWESNSICRYLAQTYAPQALYGDTVKCLGLASQWMDWANTQLEPGLHVLVMELVRLSTDKRNPANVEKTRCEIIPTLERLDRHLSERSYVAGDDFTIGDIATGCAVHRWTLFDLETPNLPYLRAWQARLAKREGFGQHVGPRERHLQ
jgi:glutathione S-transferase